MNQCESRRLFKPLLAIAAAGLSLTISGCAVWPDAGRGGFAEHQSSLLSWIDGSDKYPIGPEHGLLFEATLLKHHLDLLVLEGAELCFPGIRASGQTPRESHLPTA